MDLSRFSRQQQLAWQQEAIAGDFQHYLNTTQTYLDEVHGSGSLQGQLNIPFEWVPPGFWAQAIEARKGILLVHGLLDSPNRMRDLAKSYLDQGYLVRSLLLTGHGLTPCALNVIHKEDWLALVQFGIAQLTQDTGSCLLLGYSGGASLCLWQLLAYENKQTSRIKGLIAFAPALALNDPLSPLLPLLRWIPYPIMVNRQAITETAQYTKFSQLFGYQAYTLAKQVNHLMAQHTLPVPAYFVLAAHDETIDSNIAKAALLRDPNPQHHLSWYSPQSPTINDSRLSWYTSVYPNIGISDFSHISLCNRPENGEYGLMAYQAACKRAGRPVRPSFNPDYDSMIKRLIRFSHSLVLSG